MYTLIIAIIGKRGRKRKASEPEESEPTSTTDTTTTTTTEKGENESTTTTTTTTTTTPIKKPKKPVPEGCNTGVYSEEEESKFLEGLRLFGRDWPKVIYIYIEKKEGGVG